VAAPELPAGRTSSTAEWAVRQLLAESGLDESHFGSSGWNPMGELIKSGDRVLVKPNWVLHRNKSGRGLDCLVTHTSVIAAVLAYVAKARPRRWNRPEQKSGLDRFASVPKPVTIVGCEPCLQSIDACEAYIIREVYGSIPLSVGSDAARSSILSMTDSTGGRNITLDLACIVLCAGPLDATALLYIHGEALS
jgi:hypothetical protein